MSTVRTALASKLSSFVSLSSEELACLARIQSAPRKVASLVELVSQGKERQDAFVLKEGWAYSYQLLADGRRQVITFNIPGDFVGLRNVVLPTSNFSAATVTDAEVCAVPVTRIVRLFDECPRLAAALFWSVSRDEAIVAEHLAGLGRRSAIERTAHLFLELGTRLRMAGLGTETRFPCPLTQYLVSDSLGITAIHLNRVLRQLRERGLMSLAAREAEIHDVKGLTRLAGFDPGYLDPGERFLGPASGADVVHGRELFMAVA